MSGAQTSRFPWLVLGPLGLGAAFGLLSLWLSDRGPRIWDLVIAGGGLVLWFLLSARKSSRTSPERLALLLGCGLAIVPPLVSAFALDAPVTNDERAYLQQAEAFAAGRLADPLPAVACETVETDRGRVFPADCPLHRRQLVEDPERGVRYSKYAPGTSLAFVPGVLVGFAPLVPLLAGLASVLLVAALAARYGALPGLTALLFAGSAFFLVVQTSFQSQVVTAPLALGGFLALQRARADGGGRWSLAVGAFAGLVLLARPLTGVVLALALALGLVRRGPRALAGAVVGGLPWLALALVYDHAQTGEWLTPPYSVYATLFGPFADGMPVDVYGNGDFVAGLLEQLGRGAVGTVGILGASVLGVVGLFRARAHDGGAALAFVLLGPIAYAFHWYGGHWAYPGPLYGYEGLGLLTVGVLVALRELPNARAALVPAALVASVAIAGYRFALLSDHVAQRAAPQRVARDTATRSVVVLPVDGGRGLKLWTASLPPAVGEEWGDAPVFVFEQPRPERTSAALRALGLEDRPVLRFVPGEEPGTGRLEPIADRE